MDDENLLLVRACYSLSLCSRIGRELGAAAKIELDRANAERARATVASVHGIDPEALDGQTARKLWEAAEKHADDLDRAVTWRSSPAEKSAATRARRQCDRLENFLEVARLMHRGEDTGWLPVFAGDDVLKAS